MISWSISAPQGEGLHLFGDFFDAYYPAAKRLLVLRGGPTFPLDEPCTQGFVNIPILAWLFVPLAVFDKVMAGWIFLAIGIAAIAVSWHLVVTFVQANRIVAPLILFLFLVNGPMIYSLREANTTHIVLLLLILFLILWRAGFDFAGGLLLGFAAAIKLPLLLYGVYFALRLNWRAGAGMVAALGFIVALSFAYFGKDLNTAWYDHCVGPFLGKTMPGFNVQSLDTFIYRLLNGDRHLLDWHLIDPGTTHKIIRGVVSAGLYTSVFWLLWLSNYSRRKSANQRDDTNTNFLEFALILSLLLIVSPLTWAHYYLLLIIPWGLYVGGRLPGTNDATVRRMIIGSMILASLPVVMLPQDMGPLAPLLSRSLVSVHLLGCVLAMVALMRASWLNTRSVSDQLETVTAE